MKKTQGGFGMLGFDDILIASEVGTKEVVKMFSKLGLELSKIAAKESDKIGKYLTNEVEKLKDGEFIKGDVKAAEIKFPWDNLFSGFQGKETIDKSFVQNEIKKIILRAERHPAKLPTDIAERMMDKGELFSEQLWSELGANERLIILNEAFYIMAEEACIAKNLIDEATVCSQDFNDPVGRDTKAAVNLFIDIDENGKFFVKDHINIGINYKDLENPNSSLRDILGSLYHEVVHAMQEQSLCEDGNTFTYEEMQKEWKADVKNRIDMIRKYEKGEFVPTNNSFTDYLTESMEAWAHMQTDYFLKILDATRFEHNMAYEKKMLSDSNLLESGVKEIQRYRNKIAVARP